MHHIDGLDDGQTRLFFDFLGDAFAVTAHVAHGQPVRPDVAARILQ